MKQVHYLQIFALNFSKSMSSETILVRENDQTWYDSEIIRNSRKRDGLKKADLK